jgi:hypothetical protein
LQNNTGEYNTAVGFSSLNKNTFYSGNTAIGSYSLQFSNAANNTAVGFRSLKGGEVFGIGYTGADNTAIGRSSLEKTTIGSGNTAVGKDSSWSNISGNNNTSVGLESLYNNVTGPNTAFGFKSLKSNSTGFNNTAVGYLSLTSNTSGDNNTSVGTNSLPINLIGAYNTSVGCNSLSKNLIGNGNTAVGTNSLQNNTSGYNTALGYNAGLDIITGTNVTCIGYNAQCSTGAATNEITLGDNQIQALRCKVALTVTSDKRDKTNITDLKSSLDFINEIKPVTFNWDRRDWYESGVSDGSKTELNTVSGFIAQQLKEVQEKHDMKHLNLVYESNPEKLEITTSNLLPPLIKAVQELSSIVKNYEEKEQRVQGYLLFSQENRQDVKDSNPNMKSFDIIQRLNQMWKELGEDEQKKWIENIKNV